MAPWHLATSAQVDSLLRHEPSYVSMSRYNQRDAESIFNVRRGTINTSIRNGNHFNRPQPTLCILARTFGPHATTRFQIWLVRGRTSVGRRVRA